MATILVKCTIKGISPLLMHAYPMMELPRGWEKWDPKKQAEISEYRDPETGNLYIPGIAIQRCLINAATYSKGKGRASLQKPVAACAIVSPERINLGVKKYTIDSRPVVIPSTKGRIIRHRPRLDKWNCTFELEYDDELLKDEELRQVVDDAGKRVGLLDFRPQCKGSYGRFIVTEWK